MCLQRPSSRSPLALERAKPRPSSSMERVNTPTCARQVGSPGAVSKRPAATAAAATVAVPCSCVPAAAKPAVPEALGGPVAASQRILVGLKCGVSRDGVLTSLSTHIQIGSGHAPWSTCRCPHCPPPPRGSAGDKDAMVVQQWPRNRLHAALDSSSDTHKLLAARGRERTRPSLLSSRRGGPQFQASQHNIAPRHQCFFHFCKTAISISTISGPTAQNRASSPRWAPWCRAGGAAARPQWPSPLRRVMDTRRRSQRCYLAAFLLR
jgi:hypothetical protein